MVALTACAYRICADLDNTHGAGDYLRKHNPTFALREVCKVWVHLWDKRSRIFTPVLAAKNIENGLNKDGVKTRSRVLECISDCILWMAVLSRKVTL